MNGGVLLDPRTGRPEEPVAPSGLPRSMQANLDAGWRVRGLNDGVLAALGRAPDHVKALLERSRSAAHQRDLARLGGRLAFEPRASMQSWEEVLYAALADGAQVLNTTSETIMVPDFTLPANYLYPGRMLKYTLYFDVSTVITTPGTIILRLRYGGVAGTLLAASGAYAPDPTAASTTVSGYVEFVMVARAAGTAAASFTMGRMWLSDLDDASATTLQGNLNMHVIPVSAPAAVNVNTTTANALSPTVQFSVNTATTQLTVHVATLEALS